MHKPALSVSSNVPVAHSCGVTLPTTQYEPVGHGAQSAAAVLPMAPENLPASHSVGATDRRAEASGRAGFARLLALVALEPAAQAEHSSVPASRASLVAAATRLRSAERARAASSAALAPVAPQARQVAKAACGARLRHSRACLAVAALRAHGTTVHGEMLWHVVRVSRLEAYLQEPAVRLISARGRHDAPASLHHLQDHG